MRVFSDFFKGIGFFLKGFSFLFQKGLWYYMLYPLLLWIATLLATLFLFGELIEQITHWIENYLSSFIAGEVDYFPFIKKEYIIKTMSFFVSVFLRLAFFFIGGTIVKYVTL